MCEGSSKERLACGLGCSCCECEVIMAYFDEAEVYGRVSIMVMLFNAGRRDIYHGDCVPSKTFFRGANLNFLPHDPQSKLTVTAVPAAA